jgi:ubiquitin C-terminal hydrolase
LNLEGFALNKGEHLYEVFGIVVHNGTSKGGHYTAYTKRKEEWFYFSDSSFKPISW